MTTPSEQAPPQAGPPSQGAAPPPEHRLHEHSWMFITGATARGFVVPAIVVLVASRGAALSSYDVWGLIFLVPAVAAALLKQFVFVYRFGAEELQVRDGIFFRKERHIPYDRIQNIALVQNLFHRMLGLATVRIETASGAEAEAVMRVLSLDAVEELRRRAVGYGRARPAVAQADDETTRPPLLHLPPGELVRLGLISNRGFIVVAAASGLLWQTTWWDADWTQYLRWGRYYDQARDMAPGWIDWFMTPSAWTGRVVLGLGAVVLFLTVVRLFSIGWHLFQYYGFTLRREGDGLRAEYGLFTKVSTSTPTHRIQHLITRATPLHRWFGRASVELETAGGARGGGDLEENSRGFTEQQWLAPLVDASGVNALLRDVLPEIDLDDVSWEKLAPGARGRILKRSLIVLALPTIGVAIPFGWYALWLPALGVPLALAHASGYVRNARWALTRHAVLFHRGWWTRKLSVVRFNKMQTVAMLESPFDRRRHMASIAVDTAGGAQVAHSIEIPYLDRTAAETVARRLYAEAGRSEYRW